MPLRRAHIPCSLLLVTVLASVADVATASGLSAAMPDRQDLRQVGAGRLSWLGFDIYDASLWTDSGRYDGFPRTGTAALSLWYRRSFSRDELLEITDTAWRRLGLQPEVRAKWLAELQTLWTDVAAGQNLTTVVDAGGAARFYNHERYLGRIEDPQFGPAFLSIWLDPRSVVRDLRVQLLGEASATGSAGGSARR